MAVLQAKHLLPMKLSEDIIEGIVKILDPICHLRYSKGDVLPRGHEGGDYKMVNKTQEFRERSARLKAAKIVRLIEDNA